MKWQQLACFVAIVITPVFAEKDHDTPPKIKWSFEGPFGKYDRAELQRGLQVYKEVCSTCHGVKRLSFRSLGALGYTPAEVKAFAAQYEVPDEPNDEGAIVNRKALPSDFFPSPYPNDKAARAANNGALPPDLSLIVKARHDGPNYVHAILTGFREPPSDVKLGDGHYYNPYMSGRTIAMPPPLKEGMVTFSDGTPASVDQMARDVTAFLSWASEPELEERKALGLKVMLYLLVLSIVMLLAKRKIWSEIKHS